MVRTRAMVAAAVAKMVPSAGVTVRVAEFGTTLAPSDYEKYTELMGELMGADQTPKIEAEFTNTKGITVRILQVTGDVQKMALCRLRSRETSDFVLMWVEDAENNGLMDKQRSACS